MREEARTEADYLDDDSWPPVPKRPPKSHYWPKRSEMARRFDVRLHTVCQQIVKSAAHLDDKRYRPMIMSCARVTLLIERAWDAIAEMDMLVSESTGELRSSLQTLGQLVAHQHKLLLSLGLSPTVADKVAKEIKPVLDLEAFRAAADAADGAARAKLKDGAPRLQDSLREAQEGESREAED
jgi:hypothetical protein